jgi:AraC-like DNA-binding protein
MRRAALKESRVTDGSARFTLEEFEAIQLAALDATGDEALGLHLAEYTTDAAFDVVGHLLAHAPTLRDALRLGTEFSGIVFDDGHLVLDEEVDVARLKHAFRRISPRAARMHAEFALGGFARMIRMFVGPGASFSGAFFEHPAPAHRREYRGLFDGAERFGQDHTGLEFPRALLDVRALHHHPRLYSLFRAEARLAQDLLERGVGYAHRVRVYLSARPPDRLPNMDVAARELGLSVRSLRRRLSEEGVCYRDLVQSTLEAAAIHLLSSPRQSVQETAQATGFADASTFQRAFKQWTGCTPTEFRRKLSSAS